MKLNKLWILFVAAAMLLAACTPAAGPGAPATGTPAPATPTPEPTLTPYEDHNRPPAAVSEGLKMLAEQLGMTPDKIIIRSIEETDFPNTCLGLPKGDEACGEAVVRGYRATMTAGGETYEVRTSLDGKQVRIGGVIDKGAGAPPAQEDTPIAAAARAFLAQAVNVQPESLKLISQEEVQWSDSCLGAGRPDEICATVITPGFRVVFEADGQQYQVNTNQDGSALRLAPNVEGNPVSGGGDDSGAVGAARQMLASQLGLRATDVKVVRVDPVDWPNGCLGVEKPGQVCTQAIVPGYLVVLESQGRQYEFHTDQAGGLVLPAIPPLPESAVQVLTWEQTVENTCAKAAIGAQGVSYGPCAGPLKQYPLRPERGVELAEMFIHYRSFADETKSGRVSFTGEGAELPSEAEMRGAAEWARIAAMEAAGVREDGAEGLAIRWHQEGGIAGFCMDLEIFRSGLAEPASCKAVNQGTLPSWRMAPEDLEQLYQWVDELSSFEYKHDDNVAADGMLTTLSFTGSGKKQATAEQQKQIADFAARIYLESTR